VRLVGWRARAGTLAACVVLVAGACSDGSSEQAAKPKKPTPTSTTTTTIPVPVAPFTNLPDTDGVANGRASLAVKIENSPDARPQSGLDVADIVYEEVVEGGITRFWAVFNSRAPESVGPVRSVRAMDPGIISPLGGVIAYSGGTGPNVALVRATGLVYVDEGNAADSLYREGSRSAPHNLYGRTASLWARGGTPVPPRPMFQYVDEGESFTGVPIIAFTVGFQPGYDVTYVWNEARAGWLRYQPANARFDAIGSTPIPNQVAPQNVIVQFIDYPRGSEGDVMGSGAAWVFSNGQYVQGTWTKLYQGAPTSFSDANGEPIALTPGQTWVELFPTGGPVGVLAPPPTTTSTQPEKNQDDDKKKQKNQQDDD